MAEGPIRKPDDQTGLAITGMKPVLFPEQRQKAADTIKQKKDELME